jgi:hypothetical protein
MDYMPLPKFDKYSISSYIMYNQKSEHFRTIKPMGKDFTLILDKDVTIVRGHYS